MKTELYQEETCVGGGAEALTAEVRAAEVERRIMALVNAGEFELRHGYGYQSDGMVCHGCVLGALAWSVACRPRVQYGRSVTLRRAVIDAGLATLEEVVFLEFGFEGWTRGMAMQLPTGRGDREVFVTDVDDPFYKVGQRLRGLAR